MRQESNGEMCSICVGMIGAAGIVEIAGEVDIATVSMLAKALDDAVTSGKGDLILDTQRLTYMDSAGIRTLLSTQRALAEKSRRLALVGCHGVFQKILKTSSLESRFALYSTVDEALSDFEAE